MTDNPSGTAAVELLQVSHAYTSRHHSVAALSDVSVAFRTGTWTAIMGTSGSGKSTLLHCAGGLERPTSGRVIVSRSDITDASDRELTALRRTMIGFVFQNFNLIGSHRCRRDHHAAHDHGDDTSRPDCGRWRS